MLRVRHFAHIFEKGELQLETGVFSKGVRDGLVLDPVSACFCTTVYEKPSFRSTGNDRWLGEPMLPLETPD